MSKLTDLNKPREKELVADIVEQSQGCLEYQALNIFEIQSLAENFVDQYRDANKPGNPIMWDVVEHSEIPFKFIELLDTIARYPVTL